MEILEINSFQIPFFSGNLFINKLKQKIVKSYAYFKLIENYFNLS